MRLSSLTERLALLALLVLSGPACATAVQAPVELRAGAEIGFSPYADIDSQGRPTGFANELLAAVAKTMDIPIGFQPDQWSTVWDDLVTGRIDVLPLVARLPEREGQVEFTRPHTIGYDTFFVRRDQPVLATVEQARSRNIIVVRSDAAHQALLGRGFKRQLIEVDNLADGFRLLASGHHDALLAPLVQGNLQVKRLGLVSVVEHGPLLKEYRREFSFAVRKGNTALRDRLDQGLAIVTATGEYDRLYRKWLGIHEPDVFPVREVAWGAATAAVLFALLGLWTWQLRRQVGLRTLELARINASLEQRVDARTHELAESENRYRTLFDSMTEGFALHEIITDADGHASDYRFIDVNPAFEVLTGLKRAELVGRHVLDVLPGLEKTWIDKYGKVAQTGEPAHFDSYSEALDRWYDVVAYRPTPGHFAVIFSDITERKLAESSLREADRRKDEFLAMLAHELRNPLTPIRIAAEILERPGLDEEQLHWAVTTISDRVDHITRLVDDLLDVSRISRGRIVLKRQSVEFTELAARAVESVRPLLEARRHHFSLRLPAAPVYLDVDPVRLAQVLVNLLDNAAKYTPEGGHIELHARVVGQEIEIAVRDDGLGMPADLLPHVFELFQQGDRTLDRSQGGLGIGLSLAERLVNMHGGRIEAESAGPGQGATFTIRLPVRAGAPPAAAVQPEPPPARPGMRVLVVDDDRLVAFSLGQMLKLHGYTVRTVSSGAEALALAPDFQPQAILLDIGLVGMDGYETAQRLRELPGGTGYRLIAVSGYGDETALARSRAAGCDAHLIKPVDYRRLAAELERAEA